MTSSIQRLSSFRLLPLLTATGLALTIMSSAHAATYDIDPTHANVRFAIDHFGTSTNTGGFYNLTGKIDYDPKAKTGHVSIVIPLDTINTGNSEFDEHLKGSDFFDVTNNPTARFESTQWHFEDVKSGFSTKSVVTQVDGNLTLNGKTKPVQLTATKFNCYFSPIFKKSVCGGDFKTTIDRTQWGISKYVLLGMTKNVDLNIQIEAVKQ
ncbi:YceI family protein [Psychrobacter sp. FDAARGOS_221]|uniref:YceI family protein n=1 Tax=Psychrobacter sp. FDAARGOS_221 TaxID=1975705 RepID=UPI000BB55A63|nr:YceI family protein [Psychrobacter sp. FDAARGOS_221]PNK60724.1 polyisoprenoid-binding protein [Psychrobacter sp. FDAARGOS_221]